MFILVVPQSRADLLHPPIWPSLDSAYLARLLNRTPIESYGIWQVSQKKNLRAFSSSRRKSYLLISWTVAIVTTKAPCHRPRLGVPNNSVFQSVSKPYDQWLEWELTRSSIRNPYRKIFRALCERRATHLASPASITTLGVCLLVQRLGLSRSAVHQTRSDADNSLHCAWCRKLGSKQSVQSP